MHVSGEVEEERVGQTPEPRGPLGKGGEGRRSAQPNLAEPIESW